MSSNRICPACAGVSGSLTYKEMCPLCYGATVTYDNYLKIKYNRSTNNIDVVVDLYSIMDHYKTGSLETEELIEALIKKYKGK